MPTVVDRCALEPYVSCFFWQQVQRQAQRAGDSEAPLERWVRQVD